MATTRLACTYVTMIMQMLFRRSSLLIVVLAIDVLSSQIHCALPAAMLHIRMLSGEEVASIPVEELCDVRSLKRQLNQLKGFPPRFRQRLFGCGSRGSPLDDDTKLDSPMDLELVLLTYSVASPADADELVNAARDGSVAEVSALDGFLYCTGLVISTRALLGFRKFRGIL